MTATTTDTLEDEYLLTADPKDGFRAYLAQIQAEKKARIDAIGDVTNGAILTTDAGNRWVFLLPDMTEPGKWRMQRFDARGFSGHCIFKTHDELVEAAASERFVIHDAGALDRLQQTAEFQRGNYCADLIRRMNSNELTRDNADRLLAEYDAQPA